ncbi:MAG: hypothetical protein AB1697_09530 [Pseudomonadota bacterium]
MHVQIELWALLTFLIGLLVTFLGCVFGFAKVLGGQIDKRLDEKFQAQETAREAGAKSLREHIDRYIALGDRTATQVTNLERDFLKWQADLPVHYVRREDYVRGQTVIEAKLDALYNKLEVVQIKGAGHG